MSTLRRGCTAALAAVALLAAPLAAQDKAPRPNDRLVEALRACDLERAGQALEAGADPNARELAGQLFPLALACPGPETAQLLLRRGLDPRRRDREGYDALLLAVRAGRADVLPLLFGLGVDPNGALPPAPPAAGAPPPRSAVGNGDSALLLAVKKNDKAVVGLLLDAGADPNRPGEGGTTPLYAAVEKKQLEMARTLLTHGADANVQRDGKPVLVEGVKGGQDMLILLLGYDADINAVTADRGETALMQAVLLHSRQLVGYLIAAGADVSIRNTAGDSALDLAQEALENGKGDPEIVRMLREALGKQGG